MPKWGGIERKEKNWNGRRWEEKDVDCS